MKQTLKYLRLLIKSIEKDIKDEPDDFNYGLMQNIGMVAGQTLYQLTRGEEGIRNNLELKLLRVSRRK